MTGATRFDLPHWECLTLLRSQTVGRICILDQQTPIALPMSYRLIGSEDRPLIVLRTAPDTLVGRSHGLASFEVDHVEQDEGRAWSVLARGTLERRLGSSGLPDPEPWLEEGRHAWMVLDVAALSGRRLTGRRSPDGYWVDWEIDHTS